MTRPAEATDFFVEVPSVGTFSFAKRMLRDELRISAEYSRVTEGVETPTAWLQLVGGWYAALKVLTVTAPLGWDIDNLDPLDQESYTKLRTVHAALREKEQSFRTGASQAVQAPRPGDGDVAGVLVPAQVQPGADGPALS
jgi:hypothetical protein